MATTATPQPPTTAVHAHYTHAYAPWRSVAVDPGLHMVIMRLLGPAQLHLLYLTTSSAPFMSKCSMRRPGCAPRSRRTSLPIDRLTYATCVRARPQTDAVHRAMASLYSAGVGAGAIPVCACACVCGRMSASQQQAVRGGGRAGWSVAPLTTRAPPSRVGRARCGRAARAASQLCRRTWTGGGGRR
jgi:hypothetical protein